MPKTVPPPPPQPSVAQTRAGVRLLFGLSALIIALFLALSAPYGNDYWAVEYGRENGASWNIMKARAIDEDALRAHPGGKLVWLVGSSILRESFSQKRINANLTAQNSEWRVVKFGQTRGASGLSAGMLKHLPLRPGDQVIHSLAVENLRKNWLDFTELPDWRVLMMLDTTEIWQIKEWSIAKKIEATVAFPRGFYRYHDEAIGGWTRWLKALLRLKNPKKHLKSWHIGARQKHNNKKLATQQNLEIDSKFGIRNNDYDDSSTQFNRMGLDRMRKFCAERGVSLTLIHIPQRKEYRERFVDERVKKRWRRWLKTNKVTRFPQPKEMDFYDMKHPNRNGRHLLSSYFLTWLADPTPRPPEGWRADYFEQLNQTGLSPTSHDGIESY
jgi:hypothetical protein